jgi:type IV pilus assembly protein PilO
MAGLTLGGQSSLAKLPPAAKFGIGFFFVAVIAFGYWLVLYSDVDAKITAATRQQNDLNAELAKQKQAQASYFADKDDLAARQQQQRELVKQLPSETEPASFLSAVQQVSNLSGVDLKAWQPAEEKNEAFYAKVPMKLELGGKFHQIAKFAYEMGKVERIINLENIELTDPKVEGDEIKLKVKCLATSFRLRAKPAAAARPGAAAPAPAPPGDKK